MRRGRHGGPRGAGGRDWRSRAPLERGPGNKAPGRPAQRPSSQPGPQAPPIAQPSAKPKKPANRQMQRPRGAGQPISPAQQPSPAAQPSGPAQRPSPAQQPSSPAQLNSPAQPSSPPKPPLFQKYPGKTQISINPLF